MFSIGEFSRITGLTVKTLRFYHDEGILIPSHIDPATNYRYYHEDDIEKARIIGYLRGLEVPLSDVKEILRAAEDSHLADVLERHKRAIEEKMTHYRKVVRSLDDFVQRQRKMRARLAESDSGIVEKTLPPTLAALIHMRGRYNECGKAFGRLGRALGRHIAGPAFLLHHNAEYREDDAEFEAGFPIRQPREVSGASVRELPGGRALTLVHHGPYDELGGSYAIILRELRRRQAEVVLPTREVYLRGPGMIFKGNPLHYVTEIQLPLR